jgi:hypothetical protein
MLYPMSRVRTGTLFLIMIVGAICCLLVLGVQSMTPGRVYSVAEVRALLARHRGTWSGHTIRIRGMVTTTQETFPCRKPSCALVGIAGSLDDPAAAWLWLGQDGGNPFWDTIRRLPVIGSVAPSLQQPVVARTATYRIRLLAHPDCSGMKCYDAVLIDSALPAPPGAMPAITTTVMPVRHADQR